MEPLEIFIKKLNEIGEEEWESWTDMSRYLFLINHSPIPVENVRIKRFYRFLSQGTLKSAKSRIPSLIDMQADQN